MHTVQPILATQPTPLVSRPEQAPGQSDVPVPLTFPTRPGALDPDLRVVSLSRAVDPTPPATDAPTLGLARTPAPPANPDRLGPPPQPPPVPAVQRSHDPPGELPAAQSPLPPPTLPPPLTPSPRHASRPVELVPAVQRVDDPPPEPEPAPTPEAAPPPVTQTPAPAAASTGAPASGAPPEAVPEELVRKLFDPLLRRLKTELRLDRERRGRVTDRWR
ncbi:hypothetical protein [Actinokineospora diospyrosa]|uniref:hypothetical protein n=1 Tax=Actinokineospora diospyrosa TaxID=103728 RepID=UPI0031D88772